MSFKRKKIIKPIKETSKEAFYCGKEVIYAIKEAKSISEKQISLNIKETIKLLTLKQIKL